ncbi:DNA-directed RNA polymerase subunit epsilon [Caldibacillus lycopersici]|uniref:DNA-directed RNA polymerase subunit epsilon n=1 Tax=Perspicuibacillus lycopersici TaxID=1325689 RepID=A0AAE3IPL7_9BACI|nr:DNA-directed RNA polymerase subunit epsilon [Perspicuibacillus lycopersici]MCU9612260.1 DNA-directed RNA polymerase subunit epsilon [Perspicuibacillus lycopersici]
MIFKVYFQETKQQVPVRERTKVLYVEANSEQEVRKKLEGSDYNIEYVQFLNDTHLEYEKQSENFKIMEI